MRNSLIVTSVVVALVILVATPRVEAQVGKNQNLVNPNIAGEEELLALPHMSGQLADAIIGQRPFLDILEVDSLIGATLEAAQREEVYRRLFIPLDLNSASREAIILVPGAGSRMAREFMEYRPYVNLAQFRREIGKYVDDEEVARLEQYVFVPMNLNTASAEDFGTIPGMGPRMVREFLEYRPYAGIEQFRREIGKYVDDDEVARLERYVKVE